MDISDVAVRHLVSVPTLHISHSFDLSPSIISVAKEIRYCVVAVVLGWTTVSIVRNLVEYRSSSRATSR